LLCARISPLQAIAETADSQNTIAIFLVFNVRVHSCRSASRQNSISECFLCTARGSRCQEIRYREYRGIFRFLPISTREVLFAGLSHEISISK
jgi:hypothetical protein